MKSTNNHPRYIINQTIRIFLAIFCIYFIGTVFYIIAKRINYPFELEWMEGGSLIQVRRLIEGKNLYVSPSIEYVPQIYPPLYYYISAIFSKILQNNWFLPLRLLSLLSTIGIGALIFSIVRDRRKSNFLAFLSLGLFFATFKIGGSWFDIARVDMLFIFFLLAAVMMLEKEKLLSGIISGIFLACALLTKQTAIFAAAALIVFSFLFLRKRNVFVSIASFILVSVSWISVENYLSGGWYWYYNFTLTGLHKLPFDQPAYFGQPVLMIMPVFIITGIIVETYIKYKVRDFVMKDEIWTYFAVVLLALSTLAGINPGSFYNNYIPFYTGISILAGLRLPILLEYEQSRVKLFRIDVIYLLLFLQFSILIFSPFDQIPTADDLKTGNSLVSFLKLTKGEVLIPNHNELSILAGKKTYAHLIALQELEGKFGVQESSGWKLVEKELNQRIKNKYFSLIILDQKNDIWKIVPDYYNSELIQFESEEIFWPVTGAKTRPEKFYFPK